MPCISGRTWRFLHLYPKILICKIMSDYFRNRNRVWDEINSGEIGFGFYDHLSAHPLLAKLGWWEWLMVMRSAWKKSQKTLDAQMHKQITSNLDPMQQESGQTKHNGLDCSSPGWNKIGKLGNGQVRDSLKGPGRRNPYHGAPHTTGLTIGCIETPVSRIYPFLCQVIKGSFITNHPPGPTWSLFMTCSVKGVYYYPDPPWVPFYVDIHLKAGYTLPLSGTSGAIVSADILYFSHMW